MKFSYPLIFTVGALNVALFFGILLFYPLESVAPAVRTAFLPKAADRIVVDGAVGDGLRPSPTASPATFIFTGDIMMARNVESYIVAEGKEYPFAKVGDLLDGADLVIGNFEGTIREKRNIETTNIMSFDTTPDNVEILKAAGFDMLSLANNHADDFGSSVEQFTRDVITDAGIAPFGGATDSGSFVAHETINGTTFAFIGYHAFGETAESLVDKIKAEDAAGNFVIMYPHWGPEYQINPSSSQTFAARMFVDAGADAVIGAHPHIVQTVEIYKGVPIIYSLGNFLFDQDWSEPTKTGLVAKMTVSEDEIIFNFTPIYLQKRQMTAASPVITKTVLDQLGYPDGTFTLPRID